MKIRNKKTKRPTIFSILVGLLIVEVFGFLFSRQNYFNRDIFSTIQAPGDGLLIKRVMDFLRGCVKV